MVQPALVGILPSALNCRQVSPTLDVTVEHPGAAISTHQQAAIDHPGATDLATPKLTTRCYERC
jgi:hypothetical protein